MHTILDNFCKNNNELLCETTTRENLTAQQAIDYIKNISNILIDRINTFVEENTDKKTIRNVSFEINAFDVFANFEEWDDDGLKKAIDSLIEARHNLIANKDCYEHWESIVD